MPPCRLCSVCNEAQFWLLCSSFTVLVSQGTGQIRPAISKSPWVWPVRSTVPPKLHEKTVPSCCCSSPLCENLGYSHDGMFRLPVKPEQVAEATRVLGLSPAERQKIAKYPRLFKIAPWQRPPSLPGRQWEVEIAKASKIQGCQWEDILLSTPKWKCLVVH